MFKKSLEYVTKGPEPALLQMIAWCLLGINPLFEPFMDTFTVAYICHSAWVSQDLGPDSI